MAIIPTFWSNGVSAGHCIGSPDEGQYFAYPVSTGGQTSIEMDHNSYLITQWYAGPAVSELDGGWVAIHPGDHIVYKAWLYAESSSIGDASPNSGAVLGLDLYGSKGRLCEISTPEGTPTYPNYPATHTQDVVQWGTFKWVQVTIDFTVQSQYMADPWGAYGSGGTYDTPNAFIPWICADSSNSQNEYGHIYVCNTELYINP